jgi:excisionase family DNA binding protein
MENYISTSEAKKRLACSAQTVRNLIKSGKLEAVQMESGRFLIDEISLQNYQLDQSKGVRVAKDAKAKTKFLPNVKPKLIENSGNQLATEIKEQLGTRPEWLHLYQTLLETAVNLDGIMLECIFRTPEGGFECFSSTPAYTLPDDPFRFEDELLTDWYNYDLTVEAAKNYLRTDFRWWVQLAYQDKVIIRSKDERPPASDLGLRAWIDDQDEAAKDERHMLRAQNKRRGEETVTTLVLCGGAVALGLVLGLVSPAGQQALIID